MATTVADVRYRWYMGPEARLLLVITACLLAFGIVTVFSASAILAQSKNLGSSYFFFRQLIGIAAGLAARLIKLPHERSLRATDTRPRAVPDITGLPTRNAVRALHKAGFRVTLSSAQALPTVPAAGTLLQPGSIVKLRHIP